jgi:hypothetical protein
MTAEGPRCRAGRTHGSLRRGPGIASLRRLAPVWCGASRGSLFQPQSDVWIACSLRSSVNIRELEAWAYWKVASGRWPDIVVGPAALYVRYMQKVWEASWTPLDGTLLVPVLAQEGVIGTLDFCALSCMRVGKFKSCTVHPSIAATRHASISSKILAGSCAGSTCLSSVLAYKPRVKSFVVSRLSDLATLLARTLGTFCFHACIVNIPCYLNHGILGIQCVLVSASGAMQYSCSIYDYADHRILPLRHISRIPGFCEYFRRA